jgi:predicted nucleic acid-binding protein
VKFLLDSNVIIYHLNDDLNANGNQLFELAASLGSAYSILSRLEVLGFPMQAEARHRAFKVLELFQELPVDNDSIDRAITLRSSLKIKTVDAIIAATALTMDLPLITRNSRDFQAIAGLTLIDPFQPSPS